MNDHAGKEYHPLEVDYMCNRTPPAWADITRQTTREDIAEQILQDMAKDTTGDIKVKLEQVCKPQHSERSHRSERSVQVKSEHRAPVYNTNYTKQDVIKMFTGKGASGAADTKRKIDAVHEGGEGGEVQGKGRHAKRRSQDVEEEDEEAMVVDDDEETEEPEDQRMLKDLEDSNSDEDVSGVSGQGFQDTEEEPSRKQPSMRAATQATSPRVTKGIRHSSHGSQQPVSPKTKKVQRGPTVCKAPAAAVRVSPRKKAVQPAGKMYDRRALLATLAHPAAKTKF